MSFLNRQNVIYKSMNQTFENSPQITTAGQSKLVRGLARLIHDCRQSEVVIEQDHAKLESEADNRFQKTNDQLTAQYEQDSKNTNEEYTNLLGLARTRYETDLEKLELEQQQFNGQAQRQHESDLKAATSNWKLDKQNVNASHAIAAKQIKSELREYRNTCDGRLHELEVLRQNVQNVLHRLRCRSVSASSQPLSETSTDAPQAEEEFLEAKAQADQKLHDLATQPLGRYLDKGPVFLFLLLGTLPAVLVGIRADLTNWPTIFATWIGIEVIIAAPLVWIYCKIRRQSRLLVDQINDAINRAQPLVTSMRSNAKSTARKKQKLLDGQTKSEQNRADAEWERVSRELEAKYENRFQEALSEFKNRQQSIKTTWEITVDPYRAKYPRLLETMEADYQSKKKRLSQEHQQQLENLRNDCQNRWNQLVDRWTSGFSGPQAAVESMNLYCDQQFPDWEQIKWDDWQHPVEPVPVLRFGHYTLPLADLDKGLPQDKRLSVPQPEYSLPAVLSFPECPSLLIKAEDELRDSAIRILQNTMLRMLTAMPPGKVRYTIIDPTGLGQNFSAFMHLADYDERLVSNRIWTEGTHINQRLLDLTQHMEDVIQKYLRNEFKSIQEYNQHAGEVAEPFHILVIANFPSNFSDESARRLVSIASSGARCGVYTLISCDTKMNLPRNFDLGDLEANSLTLQSVKHAFRVEDESLGNLPLEIDSPPADEVFTAAVKAVGKHAKDFNRVEVPFASVAPPPNERWCSDSREGLEVAIGRAGATKLQKLQLGQGTSQHVLVAGKTGSGKSTLLHALITNTALHYGFKEVHFYLIDFKKGVEFQPYATFRLPQARVIAIESEREFGMSVLERLDRELQQRGDMFRSAGVQDLKGFRDAQADQLMPRILLVIDEFQEFFVKDDKIAQDASLLLDRLVRQGRAFGIHVILGSQTLAGAYSLARSTLGQMAVRIALQCSEADSHLILSEENSAARLLSRPGDAIYNNANGLFEGNHPFQVVWLSDHERETYLRQIEELAQAENIHAPPPIIFEGNASADPSENQLLRELLQATPGKQVDLAPRAWLGAAVAIQDPTSVVFQRQAGSNLLIVGQQEEAATGVLASCLISLAAGMPASDNHGDADTARFYLLDGNRKESPFDKDWVDLIQQGGFRFDLAAPREADKVIRELADELDRRTASEEEMAAPRFLLVYNLGRFRDLRRAEDDYGFSTVDEDQPVSAAHQFTRILREGPSFGIHCLVWCDTYTAVSRWLDRQTLRDMESRVLFQMSAADSAGLMDSPAASRLGMHRAIFYSEERGEFEKFRPYQAPSEEWLAWVKSQFKLREQTETSA